MSLEAESLKSRAPTFRPTPRPPTAFDRFTRLIALLVLIAALTFVYWVPFQLVGATGAALVLAILTIVGARLASRVYELRKRLDAIEAKITPAPEATQPTASSSASALSEKVEHKP
jgi:hypothetical protein